MVKHGLASARVSVTILKIVCFGGSITIQQEGL